MYTRTAVVLLALVALALGESAVYVRDGSFTNKNIHETAFGDMLCHASHVDPLHPEVARQSFAHMQRGDAPAANLLLVLDGVADEDINSRLSFAAGDNVRRIGVESDGAAVDSVAQLALMLTGERAKSNGIPARTWTETSRDGSETVKAYSSSGQPLRASFADVVVQQGVHNLTPLTVAVSADGQLADALSPRRDFALQLQRSFTFGWEADSDAFWSRHGAYGAGALLTRDDVLAAVAANELPAAEGVAITLSGDKTLMVVDVEARVLGSPLSASFDLTDHAEFLFVAELLSMGALPAVVKANSARDVAAVDFVAVGVSTVQNLQGGRAQRAVALLLVDAAFAALRAEVAALYAHEAPLVSEVLALDTQPPVASHRFARMVFDNSTGNDTTTYTAQQVADYQTALWSSVFLVVATVLMVYVFFNMDVGADSILYRTTNAPRPPGM